MLVAHAAVTVAWQDPVTGFIADRAQERLEDDLSARMALALAEARATVAVTDPRRRAARAARRTRRRATPGAALGRLVLPALERSFVVGHDPDVQRALQAGPAHYPDTPLPGEGGTVAIAGHRTTYGAPLRNLDRLRRGDAVVLKMPYGRFRYAIEKVISVKPTEVWVKRPVRRERVILTASHPPYSAARRLVAFGRLVDADLPERPRRLRLVQRPRSAAGRPATTQRARCRRPPAQGMAAWSPRARCLTDRPLP